PWHGIDPGPRFPELLVAYIEIVPSDGVKYEIDKQSGYLKVDRPQRFSSFCPSLYGFVPRTCCGERLGHLPPPRVPAAGPGRPRPSRHRRAHRPPDCARGDPVGGPPDRWTAHG